MNRSTLLVLTAAILVSAAPAQQTDSVAGAAETCTLTIASTVDGALVFLNGTQAGITPFFADTLRPGRYVVRVKSPDPGSWFSNTATDTIILQAGERRTLFPAFPSRYLINSLPSGANVYVGDSLAGTTPLLLWGDQIAHVSALTLLLDGYEQAEVTFAGLRNGSLVVPLARVPAAATLAVPSLNSLAPEGRSPLPLIVSGFSALAFGATAAYMKIQADSRNDAFRATGDPFQKHERERLDMGAGIATVGMQISVGVFLYLLLSE